jgi:hypothetical protein
MLFAIDPVIRSDTLGSSATTSMRRAETAFRRFDSGSSRSAVPS